MFNKVLLSLILVLFSFTGLVQAEGFDRNLNTANAIRSAWELRRLSESLAPGVDTRCYIAKFAAFKSESMPQSTHVISQYQRENNESDAYAIQISSETMEIFQRNEIQKIADECKSQNNS